MHKSRKLAGFTAIAAIMSATASVDACSDHTSQLCLCGPAAPLGHTHGTTPTLNSNLATQTVFVFNVDFSINQSGGPIVDATINVGDTIRWEWENGFHNVTSVFGSSESFASPTQFGPGPTYNHTFSNPGVYWYYCTIHGVDNGDGTADFMAGTITVVEQVISSSWNVDFDGSWNTASNWTNNQIPNGAGHTATFGANITGPRGVSVDSPVTVGSLNFQTNSPHFYNIGGSSTISLAGSAGGNAVVHVINNNQSIGAKLQPINDTIFQIDAGARLTATQLQATNANLTKTGTGSLAVNRVVTPGALTIGAGTVRMLTGTSLVGSLAINTSAPNFGTLDLLDQDLIVQNGSYATITGLISAARNSGNWDQPGITSASALFATPKNTTLGTLTGAQLLGLGVTTFGGFDVAASDILVKYTYYGDTDFNGTVNFDDYSRIDNGFSTGGNEWFEGDFDYSGQVNFDDYSLIDGAFNTQSGTLRNAISFLDGSDRAQDMSAPSLRLVLDRYEQFGEPYAQSFLNSVPEPTSALTFAGLTVLAASKRRRQY